MHQVLGAMKVKHTVWLFDYAKIIVDKSGVIYVAWNYLNIWYFSNLSDISIFEGTYPSNACYMWSNWQTWEILPYNFSHMFFACLTSSQLQHVRVLFSYLANSWLFHLLHIQNLFMYHKTDHLNWTLSCHHQNSLLIQSLHHNNLHGKISSTTTKWPPPWSPRAINCPEWAARVDYSWDSHPAKFCNSSKKTH